jgi:hypothetical protein
MLAAPTGAEQDQCRINPGYMLAECAESCLHANLTYTAISKGLQIPVFCDTTVGPIEIELHPKWAPWGVERMLRLVGDDYFTNSPVRFSHATSRL